MPNIFVTSVELRLAQDIHCRSIKVTSFFDLYILGNLNLCFILQDIFIGMLLNKPATYALKNSELDIICDDTC